MVKIGTNRVFLRIFLSTEFACFVAREISQVIEAMPGSVVPLAMFYKLLFRALQVLENGRGFLRAPALLGAGTSAKGL